MISNAKHALVAQTGGPRELRVTIAKVNGGVRIEVRDTGVGISKENLAKIFNHGFTTKKHGHGFGLHNCANAAQQMHGSLTAYSDGVGCGASFVLPASDSERAAYVVSGRARADIEERTEGVMLVARTAAPLRLTALTDSRVMIIGGEPVGPRHIWWNFVSSSKERIERAKRDWVEGRIGKISGDDEFIPLPER